MKKNATSLLFKKISVIVACFPVIFLSACTKLSEQSNDMSITLMDPYQVSEPYYSASYEVFQQTLTQWAKEHPQVPIRETRIVPNDYYTTITAYATTGRGLPDVWVIPVSNVYAWQSRGLLYDVTDAINESEWFDSYDQNMLQPYTIDDHIYGFPLSAGSYTIMVYDKEIWNSVGYASFPDNWDDIIEVHDVLCEKGYDCAVGFSNATTSTAVTQLLNPMVYNLCGEEWFDHLIARESDAMFTDKSFVMALDELKQVCESEIFPADFNSGAGSSALNRFLTGQCPAAILSSDSLYELQQRMLDTDPERYAQLGFAFVPQRFSSEDGTEQPRFASICGIGNALVINPKVAEDPKKLNACIEFCQYMTGMHYADQLAEQYGFHSFTRSEKTYQGNDSTWAQILNLLYGGDPFGEDASTTVYAKNMEHYLGNALWVSANTTIAGWLEDSDDTAEEIANLLQNEYERYYLPEDWMYSEYVVY